MIDESTGVKYDLTHLTKPNGYHRVDAAKMELYINVCQELNEPMIRGFSSVLEDICISFHIFYQFEAESVNDNEERQREREKGISS